MRPRLRAAGVTVLLAPSILLACAGSEKANTGDYYADLRAAFVTLEAKNARSVATYVSGNSLDADASALRGYAGNVKSFRDDLGKLKPPAGVADEHSAVIAAARSVEGTTEEVASSLSPDLSEQRVQTQAALDATRAFIDACGHLQDAAGADGHTVDLLCSTVLHN